MKTAMRALLVLACIGMVITPSYAQRDLKRAIVKIYTGY
jgi:hypothetical protein